MTAGGRWACEGWSFADVLPYFKRAENNENGGDDFHGGDGPLHVSNGRSANPLFRAFVRSRHRSRTSRRRRISTAMQQEGFGPYQLTIHEGRALERGDGLSARPCSTGQT